MVKFLLFTPLDLEFDESTVGKIFSTETGSGSTPVDKSIGTVLVSSVVRSTVVFSTILTDGLGYLGPLDFTFPTQGLCFFFSPRD